MGKTFKDRHALISSPRFGGNAVTESEFFKRETGRTELPLRPPTFCHGCGKEIGKVRYKFADAAEEFCSEKCFTLYKESESP